MLQKGFSKTPHQKLRFGTGRVWLLVVVVVVVIAAGVLVWRQLQKPGERQPPADETANWKTYRNEEYGFEVKYPEGWYVFPFTFLEIERVVFQDLPGEETESKPEEAALKDLYRLEIKIIEGEIADWLEKQEALSQQTGIKFSKEKVTFGDKEGYKINGKTLEGKEGAFRVLFKNEKLYLVETLWPEECGTAEWIGDCEVFDQILSTFRFLE